LESSKRGDRRLFSPKKLRKVQEKRKFDMKKVKELFKKFNMGEL
jgi:hypothetical protein